MIRHLLAATVAATLLAAPATLAAESSALVDRDARRPASLVLHADKAGGFRGYLRLARATTVDWSQLHETKGADVAVYLERLQERDPRAETGSGGIVLSALADSAPPPVIPIGASDISREPQLGAGPRSGLLRRLPAGRYRVHLVSTGPVRVRLPLPGLDADVRPRLRAAAGERLTTRALETRSSTTGTVARGTVRLPATRGISRTFTLLTTRATLQETSYEVTSCRDRRKAPCEQGSTGLGYDTTSQDFTPVGPVGLVVVPVGDLRSTHLVSQFYDDAPAARALGEVRTSDELESASVVGLVINLG